MPTLKYKETGKRVPLNLSFEQSSKFVCFFFLYLFFAFIFISSSGARTLHGITFVMYAFILVENEIRMVVDDDINAKKKHFEVVALRSNFLQWNPKYKNNRNAGVTCEWNVIEPRARTQSYTLFCE